MIQQTQADGRHNSRPPTGPVLLQKLRINNLLSFGPETDDIPLQELNILIGPNGAGKSNFIEAICLLRSCATDIQDILRKGGGVLEWVWKRRVGKVVALEALLTSPQGNRPLRHRLEFVAEQQSFKLVGEEINYPLPIGVTIQKEKASYRFSLNEPASYIGRDNNIKFEQIEPNRSIVTQRRDPDQYPDITYLAEQYSKISVYREWAFGRNSELRRPQSADGRTDRLEEDFSNLGLFLNKMRRNPKAKNMILDALKNIYDGVDDFDVSVEGGTVQVFLTEGDITIPAVRLSDGTLRYLCLLAILCDPTPPPLICIEEPELGLHPDILPKIADLMKDAATRTQLVVATHSDIIVDAMTDQPETILVCEKHEGQTQIERLDATELGVWLEKYRLGQLWTRGELGGTRW